MATAGIFLGISLAGVAQTSRWVNDAGGFYDVASNWDPAATPAATSDLLFSTPGVYTVLWDEITSDRVAASLRVDGGDTGPFPEVTLSSDLDPDFFQLELEPTGFNNALTVQRNASLTIGVEGQPDASLEILTAGSSNPVRIQDNGTLTVADGSVLNVGTAANRQSLTVQDSGFRLTGGAQVRAGFTSLTNGDAPGGDAPFRIEGGSILETGTLFLVSSQAGQSAPGARLEVDGPGSELRVTGFTGFVLDGLENTNPFSGGPAEAVFSGGATLTASRLTVGQDGGRSVLTLTGSGTSAAVSDTTEIGGSQLGQVSVEMGATLMTDTVLLDDGGSVQVTGAGSRWTADGTVEVLNIVDVLDGGVFEMTGGFSRNLRLGDDFHDGVLFVGGADSAFVGNATSIRANGEFSGIQIDGGSLTAADLRLRNDAQLSITGGGRVELGTLDLDDGRLVLLEGDLTLTNTSGVFRFRSGIGNTLLQTFDDNNTFTNAGTTIIEPGVSLSTRSAVGFSPGALVNEGRLNLQSSGVSPYTLTLSAAAYRGHGSLSIGNDVTLRSEDAAPLTLRGSAFVDNDGVLESIGGVVLDAGASLTLEGRVVGPVIGDRGSVIRARGFSELGDPTSPIGLATDGQLVVDLFSTLTIHDANRAQLGLLTEIDPTSSITAANGLVLDFGENLIGGSQVLVGFDQQRSFINNGEVRGISAVETLRLSGYVQGVGTFEDVVFNGTFAPGLSPAAVTLGAATYTGTLEIELGGTNPGSEYDQVNHTLGSGIATLGGTLDVSLLTGFSPEAGDVFTILTASGGFSGDFASIELPTLNAGLGWELLGDANTLTLAVIAAGIVGDYDDSGQVEQGDLNLVLNNWGQPAPFAPNGDPFTTVNVDQEELNRVLNNWGSTSAPSFGGFNIPEPTAMLLFVTFALRRRRTVAA